MYIQGVGGYSSSLSSNMLTGVRLWVWGIEELFKNVISHLAALTFTLLWWFVHHWPLDCYNAFIYVWEFILSSVFVGKCYQVKTLWRGFVSFPSYRPSVLFLIFNKDFFFFLDFFFLNFELSKLSTICFIFPLLELTRLNLFPSGKNILEKKTSDKSFWRHSRGEIQRIWK